ncbi:rhomboid family intramembrane serine protease [Thetidibacter halocola]|uniref:Rhomboid family intramembrane serine protease n=1 Tax=Thetidibacter halocola TaxID=2827239 RepID=A0A8J8B964_9RHOB|nr:rhomboid family intramembrane serine protease [Thetidibacter halocola]MBS0125539.1 rhomboid family intramembrane serine protease [Thetidibacter halocola]
MQPHEESPFNPLPPVVVALCLLVGGVELAMTMGARGLVGGPGAVGWRLAALEQYGFSAQIMDWMLTTRQFPVEHMMRFVTYPFVHGNFTHAMFAMVMLLALGKIVGETLGSLPMLAIFVLSGVCGAAVYGLAVDTPALLFGAFPSIYGLIGGFTYILWLRLGQMGEAQIRAFSLIGILLFLQLIFGLFFGGGPDWIADISGFVAGFLLAMVLIPGGWARLLQKLRGG